MCLHFDFQVLLMNEKEYKEHKEKDGWSEDEEEEEEESLEFGKNNNILLSFQTTSLMYN